MANKLKNKAFTFLYKVDQRIFRFHDYIIDKKICHRSISEYIPSVFRDDEKGIGSTGSESTHYLIIKEIFSHVKLTENDSFIDIGCGMGRVLAYLLNEKVRCKISGVEINEKSGRVALEWAENYDNVNVILGDAFELDYNDYNVFFLGRPFLPQTFKEFIEQFEQKLTHPITFIYWVDQQSGELLDGRKGWDKQYQKKILKVSGLRVAFVEQGYSVWTYTPDNN
ncbi:MAG: methyltransferase domain-containing protein [Eubacterium sp.]|nr:methyltransferase domain-containing protein [Eubacterium sp.]